jgi:hypothetical protein
MEEIKNELHELRKEVSQLKETIQELSILVKNSHTKMDGHIDFVEGVYTSVRHPLNFLKTRIEAFTGKTSQTSLPEIEYNQNGSNIGIAPHTALQK